MKSLVSRTSGTIIKAIDSILLILLANVALVTMIRREPTLPDVFDKIVVLSFCVYFISAFLTYQIQNKRHNYELLLPIVGLVVVSCVIAFGIHKEFSLYKMTTFAALIFIWICGSNYETRHDRIIPTRNRFFFSIIGLSVMFFVLFKDRFSGGYESITQLYFPIYGVISLLNMNLVNMRSAYELIESNSINKASNVSRFSTMALVMAIGLVLIVQTRFLGFWSFAAGFFSAFQNLLIGLLKAVLFPIAMLMEMIVKWIKALLMGGEKTEEIAGQLNSGRIKFDPGEIQEGFDVTPGMVQTLEIVSWVLIALISFFVLFKIYQQVRNAPQKSDQTGLEEREFVFSFKEALNALIHHNKTPFEKEELDLSQTRRRYKEALIIWRDKGFLRAPKQTPNEFLENLTELGEENQEFESLTQAYNRDRYGGKFI